MRTLGHVAAQGLFWPDLPYGRLDTCPRVHLFFGKNADFFFHFLSTQTPISPKIRNQREILPQIDIRKSTHLFLGKMLKKLSFSIDSNGYLTTDS